MIFFIFFIFEQERRFLSVCLFVRLLSFQTGDRSGELTARMNMSDLQTILGLSYSVNSSTLSENKDMDYNSHGRFSLRAAPPFAAGGWGGGGWETEAVTRSLLQERGRG